MKHPLRLDGYLDARGKMQNRLGSLFRLGEQVSYLLVCANKDEFLRLDQSKMISAKNHRYFDFWIQSTGDRVLGVNLIREAC